MTLAVAIGLEISQFHHHRSIISAALRVDDLALILDLLFAISAFAAVLLSWRETAAHEAGHGEYHSLLLFSVMGMGVFVSAQNLVTLFVGIELLSIPLYVLCASNMRREGSLESGLKYLIIGSVGSATLVYGLALVYGASGSTDYARIAQVSSGSLSSDVLLLTGIGLVIVGFAFKASIAPFHQWTPDVYEGAPTPITGFMATATKAAALGAFMRFFDVAVIGAQDSWAPMLAALAAITIIVGNVGALGQSSMKRMLGYSGVAQAGYMLGGVIVGTSAGRRGHGALPVRLPGHEHGRVRGDRRAGARRQGRRHRRSGRTRRGETVARRAADDRHAGPGRDPWHGRLHRQVPAHPRAGRRRLHVAGHRAGDRLDDLARLLPARGGGDVDDAARRSGARWRLAGPDRRRLARGRRGRASRGPAPSVSRVRDALGQPEVAFVAGLFAAASIFFGIFPSPLFDLAAHAGNALPGLF